MNDKSIDEQEWFRQKMIHITFTKRPRAIREWFYVAWNADIFYGPVPFLKFTLLASWIIAGLTGWVLCK